MNNYSKYVSFLFVMMFTLMNCQRASDWRSAKSQKTISVSLENDMLVIGNGLRIALIEGVVPEKIERGETIMYSWHRDGARFSLLFYPNNPQIDLEISVNGNVSDVTKLQGRAESKEPISWSAIVSNRFEKLKGVVHLPTGSGWISFGEMTSMKFPFLATVEKVIGGNSETEIIEWTYFSNEKNRCPTKIEMKIKYALKVGLPIVLPILRPETDRLRIGVISSVMEQTGFLARVSAIKNGHSNAKDPRFGNGGLAIVGGRASILMKEIPEGSVHASDLRQQIDGVLRKTGTCQSEIEFLEGKSGISRLSEKRYQVFVGVSNQANMFARDQRFGVLHFSTAGNAGFLNQEKSGWTLSRKASGVFASLELDNEERKWKIWNADAFFSSLKNVESAEIEWLPNGALKVTCSRCKNEHGMALLMGGNLEFQTPSEVKVRYREKGGRESTLFRWEQFGKKEYVFQASNFKPMAILWRHLEGND